MFFRAHPAAPGAHKDADPLADVETVQLPWGLQQALHLWNMAQNGIMPYSGGYLEQPRGFQAMMEFFNDRLMRMYNLTPDEVDDLRQEYAPELSYDDLPTDAPAMTSFDMFRRDQS